MYRMAAPPKLEAPHERQQQKQPLPSLQFQEQIVQLVRDNPVTVVIADTGTIVLLQREALKLCSRKLLSWRL